MVAIQPNHPTAIGALARTLIEVGKPDLVSMAIQQIAGGRSEALVEVLTALAKEVHAAPRADTALADTLSKIDTAGWSTQRQEALRTFVQACGSEGKAQAASSAPASVPATVADHPAARRGSPS